MKLYYIANARMPTEKAHGIQIAKMCEAFTEQGIPLELVVSSRGSGSIESFYGLTHPISITRIPVVDLQFLGPLGYRFTALQFMLGSYLYLWLKVILGESFVIYTVDMDFFSFVHLAWLPRKVYAEMHGVKRRGFWTQAFFNRTGVIATNTIIGNSLAQMFKLSPKRLCIEANGVDATVLADAVSKEEARRRLNLPIDRPFALYVGFFYQWKGLEILADAAPHSPLPMVLVGGTREHYEHVTGRSAKDLQCYGARPVSEIPLWLLAADVLLLPGTAHNDDSYRHTAPMKTFEYLAARRPTVVSRTPAMESVMAGSESAFWYAPDNAQSLADAIRSAYTSPDAPKRVEQGYAFAAAHTWQKRAERILAFMQVTPSL